MVTAASKFTRKKEEAIAALDDAAERRRGLSCCGYWTPNAPSLDEVPEFQDAYREARRAAFVQSVSRLQHASSAAVSTLLKVMVDLNAPASCRVRAADSVLDHTLKAIEIEDVEARVAALERAMQENK